MPFYHLFLKLGQPLDDETYRQIWLFYSSRQDNSYALSVIKSNDCKVTEIDQYIKNIALNTHECKLLMTIPAVKEFSAFCLWLSLRDIDNYKDSTH